MTHASNVWVAIALEVLRVKLQWSSEDVARYCLADVVAKAKGLPR